MRYRVLGVKLAAAAMLPLALSGCGLPVGGDKEEPGTGPAAAAGQPGRNWIMVDQGDTPVLEPLPAVVEPEEEEEEKEDELPEVEEPHAVDARCTGSLLPGRIAALDVEPGRTTAQVTWYHPGDPTVVDYRVTSIAQSLVPGEQREFVWQKVAVGEGCDELTATVTGLEPESAYVFSVDAVRQPTWQNGTRTVTVARSKAVMTQ
jgi:hypothetical protein